MTMPKKKRRNIVVDGKNYHWAVDGGLSDAYVRIQDASGRGGILSIQFVGYVMPRHVERAIRMALANGWKPERDQFMELGGTDDDRVPFEIKPEGAKGGWFFHRYPGLLIPAGTKPLPMTGRLQFLEKIPASPDDVDIVDRGHLFGPDLTINFKSSLPEIERWIDACPETRDVQPTMDGDVRTYNLTPTGDFSLAEITVNGINGEVQIHCKPNLIFTRA